MVKASCGLTQPLARVRKPETMMAASVADYAATANERGGPSPRVAALLSILTPGLGHVYIGQARLGIGLAPRVIARGTLLLFARMGGPARFWAVVVSLAPLA